MSEQAYTPIYIFIGPPGSGKGSLAQLCKQRLGWLTLSTGDLCRSHIASQTEIGKRIDFYIKSGKLIRDEDVIAMVRDWLQNNVASARGIILDGFPRTREQAQALDSMLQKLQFPCCLRVVELCLDDEAIKQRLTQRRVCSNTMCQAVYTYAQDALAPEQRDTCDTCACALRQRNDDAQEVVARRLHTYHETAGPLLRYYRERPEYLGALQAHASLEDVYASFIALTQ